MADPKAVGLTQVGPAAMTSRLYVHRGAEVLFGIAATAPPNGSVWSATYPINANCNAGGGAGDPKVALADAELVKDVPSAPQEQVNCNIKSYVLNVPQGPKPGKYWAFTSTIYSTNMCRYAIVSDDNSADVDKDTHPCPAPP